MVHTIAGDILLVPAGDILGSVEVEDIVHVVAPGYEEDILPGRVVVLGSWEEVDFASGQTSLI